MFIDPDHDYTKTQTTDFDISLYQLKLEHIVSWLMAHANTTMPNGPLVYN